MFFQDFLSFGLPPTPHPDTAAVAVGTREIKMLKGPGLDSRLGAADGEQRLFLHTPPFFSSGPQLIPRRLDWEGKEHRRSFEDLVSKLFVST